MNVRIVLAVDQKHRNNYSPRASPPWYLKDGLICISSIASIMYFLFYSVSLLNINVEILIDSSFELVVPIY